MRVLYIFYLCVFASVAVAGDNFFEIRDKIIKAKKEIIDQDKSLIAILSGRSSKYGGAFYAKYPESQLINNFASIYDRDQSAFLQNYAEAYILERAKVKVANGMGENDRCHVFRNERSFRDVMDAIGVKEQQTTIQLDPQSDIRVWCIDPKLSIDGKRLKQLMMAIDVVPSVYEINRYLTQTAFKNNSSLKSKDKMKITDVFSEKDVHFENCETQKTADTAPCALKTFIKHSVLGLFKPTPVSISKDQEKLFLHLKEALGMLNSIDANTAHESLDMLYSWVYDLIGTILTQATPPLHRPEEYNLMMQQLLSSRMETARQRKLNEKIKNENFMGRGGMSSMHTVIKACTGEDLSVMDIGDDVRMEGQNRFGIDKKNANSMYYEYSDFGLSEEKEHAKSFVMGLSSVSNLSSKKRSDAAGKIKKRIKHLKSPDDYVTIIVDNTIELPAKEDPAYALLDEFQELNAQGKVNFILVKSMQKHGTLGTGKVRGGNISLFNNGDSKFKKCREEIDERTNDTAFKNGTEGQLLMHLLQENFSNGRNDDIRLLEIQRDNAEFVEKMLSTVAAAAAGAADGPKRAGPFLFSPKMYSSVIDGGSFGFPTMSKTPITTGGKTVLVQRQSYI